ncbi:hypothetical protein RFI_28536 [Reticulomyxa filosa]|uniref:Fe2OG dioxygenase domain-containing protein n=1 Tax=Reticulomyxa filosa TaxID=46433 RepID=X6M4D6_RETFI|nr:hypothetical protein RFI_28536 [Reticulomyxa filosa]|eukprot:ETO08853.1 hypothetical protein RFI_28536 [Reticulomyxa filosa]
MILNNHTFAQLTQVSEKAQQCNTISEKEDSLSPRLVEKKLDLVEETLSSPPAKQITGTGSMHQRELSLLSNPRKRRRYKADHPCFVPNLRDIMTGEYWSHHFQKYIEDHQPSRLKYLYFLLLIDDFYQYRLEPHPQKLAIPNPHNIAFKLFQQVKQKQSQPFSENASPQKVQAQKQAANVTDIITAVDTNKRDSVLQVSCVLQFFYLQKIFFVTKSGQISLVNDEEFSRNVIGLEELRGPKLSMDSSLLPSAPSDLEHASSKNLSSASTMLASLSTLSLRDPEDKGNRQNDKNLERQQLAIELQHLDISFDVFQFWGDTTQSSPLYTFKEYCLILYYNFIRKGSPHLIQLSDKQLIADIEKSFFHIQVDQKDGLVKKTLKSQIPFTVFDKMWLAVFRYVHQVFTDCKKKKKIKIKNNIFFPCFPSYRSQKKNSHCLFCPNVQLIFFVGCNIPLTQKSLFQESLFNLNKKYNLVKVRKTFFKPGNQHLLFSNHNSDFCKKKKKEETRLKLDQRRSGMTNESHLDLAFESDVEFLKKLEERHTLRKESEKKSRSEDEATEDEDPISRIEEYLKSGKSLRDANIKGVSFLMYCCATINEELGCKIIEEGIDVDMMEPWDYGQTPLHVCAQMDMYMLAEKILEKSKEKKEEEEVLQAVTDDMPVQYGMFESGGRTPIHYSAIHGNTNLLKLFLRYIPSERQKTALLQKDMDGNDVWTLALMYKHFDIAKYLMELNCWVAPRDEDASSLSTIDLKAISEKLQLKRNQDSKTTRARFDQYNDDIVANEKNCMRQVFVVKNVLSEQLCKQILHYIGSVNMEWTTTRHRSYATTDIPSYYLDFQFDEWLRQLLRKFLFPSIIEKYHLSKSFEFGFKDLFFVKYSSLGQNHLQLHRDGSFVSFNLLLNDKSDFVGGGTFFQHLDQVVEIQRGQCCIHSGKVLHAGNAITQGERYILVGFLEGKDRSKNSLIK